MPCAPSACRAFVLPGPLKDSEVFMFHRFSRTARAVALSALASAALVPQTSLFAQGSLREQTRGTSGPEQVISINPFLPLFGYFQAEFERRLLPNVSFALAGSHVKFDEVYTNLDAKLRLYPQERALHGLGLSAGLGYGSVRRNEQVCDTDGDNCRRDRTTESAPTFSVEAQHQWLLGSSQATAVTIGGGVKRYFISEDRSQGIQRVMPTMRLTIGYAF